MTSAHLFFQVGVPLEVVHLTDEYWEKVVSSALLSSKCSYSTSLHYLLPSYSQQGLVLVCFFTFFLSFFLSSNSVYFT